MTQNVPSREAIPGIVQPILDAGADGLKLYFGLTADMGEAIIRYADGRVPVTGHIGYMRASEAVRAGINGLEHISPSVFNDVCPAHLRFGVGTSMAGRQFVERLRAGWLAADFTAPDAQSLIDAMAQASGRDGHHHEYPLDVQSGVRRGGARSRPQIHRAGHPGRTARNGGRARQIVRPGMGPALRPPGADLSSTRSGGDWSSSRNFAAACSRPAV